MLSLSTLAVVITLLIGIPVLWFSIQVMYACLPRKTPIIADMDMRGDVAVLIPAHNESVNLLPTLHAVLAERWESMRILLVADNCTDDTAEIARCLEKSSNQ